MRSGSIPLPASPFRQVSAVFAASSVLWTLYAAFTDMHLYRPADIPTSFVGLENYTEDDVGAAALALGSFVATAPIVAFVQSPCTISSLSSSRVSESRCAGRRPTATAPPRSGGAGGGTPKSALPRPR